MNAKVALATLIWLLFEMYLLKLRRKIESRTISHYHSMHLKLRIHACLEWWRPSGSNSPLFGDLLCVRDGLPEHVSISSMFKPIPSSVWTTSQVIQAPFTTERRMLCSKMSHNGHWICYPCDSPRGGLSVQPHQFSYFDAYWIWFWEQQFSKVRFVWESETHICKGLA